METNWNCDLKICLADNNVLVNPNDSWTDQEISVCKSVAELLTDKKVDAIINMAGNIIKVIITCFIWNQRYNDLLIS